MTNDFLRKMRILSTCFSISGVCIFFLWLYNIFFDNYLSDNQVLWLKWIGGLFLGVGMIGYSFFNIYRSSKLNLIRTFASMAFYSGVLFGYLGLLMGGEDGIIILMILCALFLTLGLSLYTFAGSLSLQTPNILCPACKTHTKVLGLKDRCGRCLVPLSFDPRDKRIG